MVDRTCVIFRQLSGPVSEPAHSSAWKFTWSTLVSARSSRVIRSAQQPCALEPLVHVWNQFFTEVPQSLVCIELLQLLLQARAYMNDPADLRRNLVTFPKVLQHFVNRGLLHHPGTHKEQRTCEILTCIMEVWDYTQNIEISFFYYGVQSS